MKNDPLKEYLKASEPDQVSKGYIWRTAIGLQAVDGLNPSRYLIDTAIQNIEGKITVTEARDLIDGYYKANPVELSADERTEEADRSLHALQKYWQNRLFPFLLMSTLESTEDFFRGSINMRGKFATIISRKKNGC